MLCGNHVEKGIVWLNGNIVHSVVDDGSGTFRYETNL